MFGRNKERAAPPKRSGAFEEMLRDDIVGEKEWKQSKVGYLSGFSAIGKVVGGVATNWAQSVGRMGMMFKMITREDDLPTLPDVDADRYDGHLRFRASMQLQGKNEKNVLIGIRNTRRSAFFYGTILVAAVAYTMVDLLFRTHMPMTTLALHMASVILSGAYTFKAACYNWYFRHQRLESPLVFIRSGDWLPKA